MPIANPAIQAYKTASRYRSQRDQEADVFRRAVAGLKDSKTPNTSSRSVRWLTIDACG